MDLTRRQLIVASAAGASSIALFQPTAAHATSSAPPAWNSAPGSLRELRYFSSNFTVAYRLAFPSSIKITAEDTSPRVVEVQADLDARLITMGESVAVGDEDSVVLGPEVARDQTEDRDVAAYLAPMISLGAWDSVSVALPFVIRPLYPNDGIDASEGIGVGLSPNQAGGFTDVWEPEILAADGLAWGGKLSAVWGLTSKGSEPYPYPSSVSIESVGPGEIPAGATLTISLDRSQIASVDSERSVMPPGSVFAEVYNTVLTKFGDRWEFTITLLDATPSGSKRTIRLVTQEADGAPAMTKASTVTLAPGAGPDVWQRQTGRETIRFSGTPTEDLPRAARGNQ